MTEHARKRGSWLANTGRLFSIIAAVCLCLGISVAAAGVVEAFPQTHGATAPSTSGAVNKSSCPAVDTCRSLPCKHTGHCPTVEATPTTDLGTDQWVYLYLSNFHAGDVVEISFCTATKPLSSTAEPMCDAISTATLPNPQQEIPIFQNGTAVTSFHVELNPPSPGNVPFAGVVPGTIPPKSGRFFCDNGPQKCAVVITDSSLAKNGSGIPTRNDTVEIPVKFRSSSAGCPTAQFVFTSSDFSVEQLFPHESGFACTEPNPVVPVDTASDSGTALQSLLTGGTSVAFVTNPLSPGLQQLMKVAGGKFAIIPVAASAVVLGYQATMQQGVGSFYGFSSERLTPSQVAGLITYNYATPYGSDMVQCPSKITTELNQTPSPAAPCPLIQALNAVNGYTAATAYGIFMPSYQSGVTRTLLGWICSAPNDSVVVDGYRIHDPNLAAHELTSSDYDSKWPIKTCAAVDQFPAVPSPNSAQYALLNSPAIQGKFLRQFQPPPQFETHASAAFAPLDWSEARYLGLDAAALQNAAGVFVAPRISSVEAALAAAKIGPSGVIEPSFTAKKRSAYPLPEVTYAVVPTAKLTSTTATQVRNLLDELLTFTGGSQSTHLPEGYAPLPTSLYEQALDDVNTEIVAAPTPTTTTTTTTTTTPTTTTTTVPVTPTTSTIPTTTTTSTVPPTTTTTTSTVPPTTTTVRTVRHVKPPPVVSFAPVLLRGSGSRLALPLIVAGGSFSLIPGTLLLARRRVRTPENYGNDDEGAAGND